MSPLQEDPGPSNLETCKDRIGPGCDYGSFSVVLGCSIIAGGIPQPILICLAWPPGLSGHY
jgi:hypothetical protein